ncbi:MAG: hypothetical protein OK457_01485 [Thaumarchaeota archaeon]|nr:hypothetical protein [Nitrososphaerota archaeon]
MQILYGISSIGLGHGRRSLAIAESLRKSWKDAKIEWVTSEPVISFLEQNGERVLPVSRKFQSLSTVMERGVISGQLQDMSRVARASSKIAKENYFLLKEYLKDYDVLIQDEFSETMFAFMWDSRAQLPPFRVLITDYVQLQSRSSFNLLSRITIWYTNRMLGKAFDMNSLRIYADDLDSIPDLLRSKIGRTFEIVGPIIPSPPAESKAKLKEDLIAEFWGNNDVSKKLLVISVGGTSIGKILIDFVFANIDEISRKLECLVLILLGPRVEKSAYNFSGQEALRFVPFTPDALRFFKAADCVVTQAGASTLNEVASLGTPCVVVPIENHFEQEANAERFSEKYGFPRLSYGALNATIFVESVEKSLMKAYVPSNPTHGAEKAASLITQLIS